jgi:hypothetical protein
MDIFTECFCSSEGYEPVCQVMNQVGNISDHVDPKLKVWSDNGITQYYQFELRMDEAGVVQVRARESTAGDEVFRGLSRVAHMSCSESTPVWDQDGDSIRWNEIPDAKLKEPNPQAEKQYMATIEAGWRQWGYSDEQFTGLTREYERLARRDPIPFHWFDRDIEGLDYSLLPFKKGRPGPAAAGSGADGSGSATPMQSDCEDNLVSDNESDSEDIDEKLVRRPETRRTEVTQLQSGELVDEDYVPDTPPSRGPGSAINPHNIVFHPQERERLRETDPMMGFKVGMDVCIRSKDGADDGFWLGRLCDAPPVKEGDPTREEDEAYLGIHWYGKKSSAKRDNLQWNQRGCKWELQYLVGPGPQQPFVEAQPISVVGSQVQFTKDGALKKTPLNLDYINWSRKMWGAVNARRWTK